MIQVKANEYWKKLKLHFSGNIHDSTENTTEDLLLIKKAVYLKQYRAIIYYNHLVELKNNIKQKRNETDLATFVGEHDMLVTRLSKAMFILLTGL